MESRKSSRKPAPTCPSKCLQVYSWNCCLAGMPRKFEETPVIFLLRARTFSRNRPDKAVSPVLASYCQSLAIRHETQCRAAIHTFAAAGDCDAEAHSRS